MKYPFIAVKNVKKVFFDKGIPKKEALKGLDIEIHEGEILGLLGVNGAGKTTLSNIIASLNPPTSGEVLWNGKSIYNDLYEYRKIVGYCPQHPTLFEDLTLDENLIFSARCYGMTPLEALERKEELVEKFSIGEYLGATTSSLSGGYRQRFLIARTLMHRPKLVILDEPTVGLDPQIRRKLWESIRALKEEGVSVILTTHFLDEAEVLSDRVCIIHNGEKRMVDTPKNLMKSFKKKSLEDVFINLLEDQEIVDDEKN